MGVVIVSYESAKTLPSTLADLPLDRLGQVVVIDNASADGSAMSAAGYAGVEVTPNAENCGFGAACNQGRASLPAQLKFLLFLNPDCRLNAADLIELVRYLRQNPNCGLVAPRLKNQHGWMTSAGDIGGFTTELWHVVPPKFAGLLPKRRHPSSYAVTGRVGYVEGACMLFRAAAFDRIGGFDTRYFLFYEELDIARRLAQTGYSVDLCASANAHHVKAVSRAALGDRARVEMWHSAISYLERWHGRWQVALFKSLGLLYLLERTFRGQIDRDLARRLLASLRKRSA